MIIVQYVNPVNCFGYIGLPSSPAAESEASFSGPVLSPNRGRCFWKSCDSHLTELQHLHGSWLQNNAWATFNQHTMKSGINDTQNWMGINPNMFLQLCWVEQTCKYFSLNLFLVFLVVSFLSTWGKSWTTHPAVPAASLLNCYAAFIPQSSAGAAKYCRCGSGRSKEVAHPLPHTLGPVGRGQH